MRRIRVVQNSCYSVTVSNDYFVKLINENGERQVFFKKKGQRFGKKREMAWTQL